TIRRREYWDIPVCPLRGLHLRPGEHANVAIRYGQCRPLHDVVWTGRGDQWVTQIVYGARSRAVAIKVVNVWTEIQIIQEDALSAKARVRHEAYEQMLWDAAPPAVFVSKYKWTTKLLVRPKEPEPAQVTKIVEELHPQRDTDGVELAEDAMLGAYSPSVIGLRMAVEVSPELVTLDVNTQDSGEVANSGSSRDVLDEMAQGSECDALQDDPSIEDEEFGLSSSAVPGTLLARIDAAYTRCMRVSGEEHDLEPAVYIHKWGEHMSQLTDQLVMLPDVDDLSPECDIEGVDVGEPCESTETQERPLKTVLKRHRNIFLGDGNAAPPPARGVICDLDMGDARPVAQQPDRSVCTSIKVYKLLKKLLEATLIEHSKSPWVSPIVIVHKKNGVDI
ncbi:reverse transcriptase, partial [Phytophthora megakarya]